MVGDMITDVIAGLHAGCRGSILVRTGKPFRDSEYANQDDFFILDDLTSVADLIIGSTRQPH